MTKQARTGHLTGQTQDKTCDIETWKLIAESWRRLYYAQSAAIDRFVLRKGQYDDRAD